MIELFPDEDYRFQLRLERGSIAEFFGPTSSHRQLVEERKRWLNEAPRTYAALLPEGEPLLDEAIELAEQTGGVHGETTKQLSGETKPWDRCLALGKEWEPDFLLLASDRDGQFRLVAACVCFPSSWSLAEKIGRALGQIHEVVPGLNDQIGPQISAFLSRIKPGAVWLRSNWGLSRSPELNQHPARGLPRLDPGVTANEVWRRVEHQALVALPKCGGILFGIRIQMQSLTTLRNDPELVRGLRRAVVTMPEAVARYKGITPAKSRILELLDQRV